MPIFGASKQKKWSENETKWSRRVRLLTFGIKDIKRRGEEGRACLRSLLQFIRTGVAEFR